MGKGDVKSKRGKIARGSFGVLRPKKNTSVQVAVPAKLEKKETKPKKAKK